MPVKYKIVGTMNPGTRDKSDIIYSPRLCDSEQVNTSYVSKILSSRSSVSKSDIYNVLIGLAELLPELLEDGKTVKLDGFGVFRLYAEADSFTDSTKVNAKSIKGYKLKFLPDKEMKKELKKIKAVKA